MCPGEGTRHGCTTIRTRTHTHIFTHTHTHTFTHTRTHTHTHIHTQSTRPSFFACVIQHRVNVQAHTLRAYALDSTQHNPRKPRGRSQCAGSHSKCLCCCFIPTYPTQASRQKLGCRPALCTSAPAFSANIVYITPVRTDTYTPPMFSTNVGGVHYIIIIASLSLHHHHCIIIIASLSLHHYHCTIIIASLSLHDYHCIIIIASLSLHHYIITNREMPIIYKSQMPTHHTFYPAYHFKSRKCQLITLFTTPITLRVANANSSHILPCLPLYRKRLFITLFTMPITLRVANANSSHFLPCLSL